MTVLYWLMDSDPSIRWQMMPELTDEASRDVDRLMMHPQRRPRSA
jgi:hypothetical protein